MYCIAGNAYSGKIWFIAPTFIKCYYEEDSNQLFSMETGDRTGSNGILLQEESGRSNIRISFFNQQIRMIRQWGKWNLHSCAVIVTRRFFSGRWNTQQVRRSLSVAGPASREWYWASVWTKESGDQRDLLRYLLIKCWPITIL